MRRLCILLFLPSFLSLGDGDNAKILSRKRRFLTFPEGSTFGVTLSNTKGLMWDVPTFGHPPWNSIMEFDLIFKLTNVTKLFLKHKNFSHRNGKIEQLHRQERSNVYRQIEEFLDVQGIDGQTCVSQAVCEAKFNLKPGRSLLEDFVHALFTFPDRGTGRERRERCEEMGCPFSILGYILHAQFFTSELQETW